MARTPPTPPTKAIVGAGAPIRNGRTSIKPLRAKGDTGWQDQAWGYYDLVGEFRYATDLTGSMVSKASLGVERLNDEGTDYEPVTSGPAHEALMEFYGGPTGHSEYLRDSAINLSVPGEFFTVSWKEGGMRWWRTVPRDQVSTVGGKTNLSAERIPDDGLLLFRQWEPHPRHWQSATSPARALLPTLGEIHRLSQHVQAQVISRLATNGLFLITDQVDVSPPEGLVDEDKVASMSSGD